AAARPSSPPGTAPRRAGRAPGRERAAAPLGSRVCERSGGRSAGGPAAGGTALLPGHGRHHAATVERPTGGPVRAGGTVAPPRPHGRRRDGPPAGRAVGGGMGGGRTLLLAGKPARALRRPDGRLPPRLRRAHPGGR